MSDAAAQRARLAEEIERLVGAAMTDLMDELDALRRRLGASDDDMTAALLGWQPDLQDEWVAWLPSAPVILLRPEVES